MSDYDLVQELRANDWRERMRFCEGRMRYAIQRCRGWRGLINRLIGLHGEWRESVNGWHQLWRDWRRNLRRLEDRYE